MKYFKRAISVIMENIIEVYKKNINSNTKYFIIRRNYDIAD